MHKIKSKDKSVVPSTKTNTCLSTGVNNCNVVMMRYSYYGPILHTTSAANCTKSTILRTRSWILFGDSCAFHVCLFDVKFFEQNLKKIEKYWRIRGLYANVYIWNLCFFVLYIKQLKDFKFSLAFQDIPFEWRRHA